MATNQLDVTTGSQSQVTTQSPQVAGTPGVTGAKSSRVQPGTATALLNNSQGVSLNNEMLSTVSITGDARASSAVVAPVQPKHHVNPALFGFSALLLFISLALVWSAKRSAKSTT